MSRKFSALLILFLSFPALRSDATGNMDFGRTQDAEQVPFDNSTNGFTSEDVQAAIEEVNNNVAVSASPGFTWGRSGNISNTYLQNDTVPSNTAGRLVPVTTGEITTIFAAAENTSSATIEIRRRVGVVFTTIATCPYGGTRKVTCNVVSPPSVALNDELAVYVSGSAKNPVVGIIIKGSL